MCRKGRQHDGDMLSSVMQPCRQPERVSTVRTMQVIGQGWVKLGQRPWKRQMWCMAPIAEAQMITLTYSSPERTSSGTLAVLTECLFVTKDGNIEAGVCVGSGRWKS